MSGTLNTRYKLWSHWYLELQNNGDESYGNYTTGRDVLGFV